MKSYQYIILSALLFSCGSPDITEETKAPQDENFIHLNTIQVTNAAIETGVLTKTKIAEEITLNGHTTLPPQNLVTVSFPLGGYLKETKLIPGMKVRKGEILAWIEHESIIRLQQDYLSATASLKTAKGNFERQQKLNENKISSDKILQEAEEAFQSLNIQVRGLEANLRLIGINPSGINYDNIQSAVALRSPISGYVATVNANTGKYLNATDEIFELVNPQNMLVSLVVFEKDLSKIATGLKVNFLIETGSEKYTASGTVKMISPMLNSERTATITCSFDQQPENLLPGMFVQAVVRGQSTEKIVAEEQSIVRKGNQQYLLEVMSDTSYRFIPVTTGIQEGNLVSVEPVNNQPLEGMRIVTLNAWRIMSQAVKEE